jgi:hypothetical protein
MNRLHCDICDTVINERVGGHNHDCDLVLTPGLQVCMRIELPARRAPESPDICAGCWDAIQDAINGRMLGARTIREAAS